MEIKTNYYSFILHLENLTFFSQLSFCLARESKISSSKRCGCWMLVFEFTFILVYSLRWPNTWKRTPHTYTHTHTFTDAIRWEENNISSRKIFISRRWICVQNVKRKHTHTRARPFRQCFFMCPCTWDTKAARLTLRSCLCVCLVSRVDVLSVCANLPTKRRDNELGDDVFFFSLCMCALCDSETCTTQKIRTFSPWP